MKAIGTVLNHEAHDGGILIQDSASSYTSKFSNEYLEERNIIYQSMYKELEFKYNQDNLGYSDTQDIKNKPKDK